MSREDAIVYQSDSDDDEPRQHPASTRFSPRAMAWIVWLAIAVGGPIFFFILGGLLRNPIPIVIFILLLIPRVNNWLTNLVLSQVIRTIRCPGCQDDIPAIGRWRSGGFNDHRERHVLQVRNPIDGTLIGHINCPRCDSTILVR